MRILILIMLIFPNQLFSECKAFLINGGSDPNHNVVEHHTDLKYMYLELIKIGCKPENITIASASGSESSKDFNSSPKDAPTYTSIDYKFLNPKTNIIPATRKSLSDTFDKLRNQNKEEDEIFVYTTDHGGDKLKFDSGVLNIPHTTLWNGQSKENESKDYEYADKKFWENNLKKISKGKIKVYAYHCFSGFMNEISLPNYCSITSSDRNRASYYSGEHTGAQAAGVLKYNKNANLNQISGIDQRRTRDVFLYGNSLPEREAFSVNNIEFPISSAEQLIFNFFEIPPNHSMTVLDLQKIMWKLVGNSEDECNFSGLIHFPEEIKSFVENINQLNISGYQLKKLNDSYQLIFQSPEYKMILKQNKICSEEKNSDFKLICEHNLEKDLFKFYRESEESPFFIKEIMKQFFLNFASPEQINQYKKVEQCLSEPLFSYSHQ